MLLLNATEVASGLGFPEGPLVLPDGRIAFVEEYGGCVSVLEDGKVRTLAMVGGNPNGLALGADGLVYVTRGRGAVGAWHAPEQVAPAIVAVDPSDGTWEVATTSAGGRPLRAPNDLCFGPDGALFFTDPDDFVPSGDLHGWICRHTPAGTESPLRVGQHLSQRPRDRPQRTTGVDGVASQESRWRHLRRWLGGPRAAWHGDHTGRLRLRE